MKALKILYGLSENNQPSMNDLYDPGVYLCEGFLTFAEAIDELEGIERNTAALQATIQEQENQLRELLKPKKCETCKWYDGYECGHSFFSTREDGFTPLFPERFGCILHE